MLEDNRDRGISFKGNPTGNQFIQYDAKRIDVGSMIHFIAACLLRGHICRRAADQSRCSLLTGMNNARQPKIGDDWFHMFGQQGIFSKIPVFAMEEDVCWFDVAMDDALCMGIIQPGNK